MIDTVKNCDGFVCGYIEWQILDSLGIQKNGGEYVYIKNMWVHPRWRNAVALKLLIKKIYDHPYSKSARFVYWETAKDALGRKILEEDERSFTVKRMSKIYNKEDFAEKTLKGEQNAFTFFKVQV